MGYDRYEVKSYKDANGVIHIKRHKIKSTEGSFVTIKKPEENKISAKLNQILVDFKAKDEDILLKFVKVGSGIKVLKEDSAFDRPESYKREKEALAAYFVDYLPKVPEALKKREKESEVTSAQISEALCLSRFLSFNLTDDIRTLYFQLIADKLPDTKDTLELLMWLDFSNVFVFSDFGNGNSATLGEKVYAQLVETVLRYHPEEIQNTISLVSPIIIGCPVTKKLKHSYYKLLIESGEKDRKIFDLISDCNVEKYYYWHYLFYYYEKDDPELAEVCLYKAFEVTKKNNYDKPAGPICLDSLKKAISRRFLILYDKLEIDNNEFVNFIVTAMGNTQNLSEEESAIVSSYMGKASYKEVLDLPQKDPSYEIKMKYLMCNFDEIDGYVYHVNKRKSLAYLVPENDRTKMIKFNYSDHLKNLHEMAIVKIKAEDFSKEVIEPAAIMAASYIDPKRAERLKEVFNNIQSQ